MVSLALGKTTLRLAALLGCGLGSVFLFILIV